jgi:sphingomyelin phosphodiesterase acid-like 3
MTRLNRRRHILLLACCFMLSIAATSFALPLMPSDADKNAKFNFLAMADIHFDPFINCAGTKVCPLIEKLRSSSITEWPQIFTQYDVKPQQYRQDTNYQLFMSALKASKQVVNTSHAQFVLVLGDFMGHEFRKNYKRYSSDKTAADYQSFSRKILAFITKQLAVTFPTVDVYSVAGNNDSYQGDYFVKPNGAFFSDAAVLWSGLIKNPSNQFSMQKQFSYAGYYSLVVPYPNNLRLIVMNTNLFSDKVKGKNINIVAMKELNWLHAELQAAKNLHQSVFIAMHIPDGIDFYATNRTRLFRLVKLWQPQYIKRFEAELELFSTEIAGIFSGHLHRNWFQVIDEYDHEIPVIGVTSISPIFGNNPGFRNISYYAHPIHLDDIATYSFPINGGGSAWVVKHDIKQSSRNQYG